MAKKVKRGCKVLGMLLLNMVLIGIVNIIPTAIMAIGMAYNNAFTTIGGFVASWGISFFLWTALLCPLWKQLKFSFVLEEMDDLGY